MLGKETIVNLVSRSSGRLAVLLWYKKLVARGVQVARGVLGALGCPHLSHVTPPFSAYYRHLLVGTPYGRSGSKSYKYVT